MKKAILLVVVCLLAFSLFACSSNTTETPAASSDAAATGEPAAETTEAPASAEPEAETTEAATEESDDLDSAAYQEGFQGPTDSITPPESLKIAYVAQDAANTGSSVPYDAITEICNKLGYTLQLFDGRGTVEEQNTGIIDAVSWDADVIVCASCQESSVQQGIMAAYDAGIPIVGVSNGTDDPNPKADLAEGQMTYLFDVGPYYYGLGQESAEWVYNDSNGEGKVVVFDNDSVDSVVMHSTGMREGFDELGIEYEVVEFSIEQVGDALNRMVTGYVQSHPDVEYVSVIADPFTLGVVQALDAAGLTNVKVISVLGSVEYCALIRQGSTAAATAAYDSYYMGYATMDQVFRYLDGGEEALWAPHGENVPMAMVDSTNLPAEGEAWAPDYDYVSAYYALWGVS